MNLNAIFNPASLALLLPVVVVLGWIVSMVIRHRERMAMIEHGLDPDSERRTRPQM